MRAEQTTEQGTFRVPSPSSDRSSLFLRIAPWVSQLVKRRESDGERRKDLYQDTWLSVWLALEPTEGARPGLAQAMDVAAEAVSAHQQRGIHEDQFDFVPLEQIELPAASDPEADALHRESSRELLSNLLPIERDILALHVQGFSLLEIHALTGLPRSSVQNRLERTLRVLQAKTHIKNP